MIDERYLRNEEKVIYGLRSLYGRYGYLPFNMSKFEEYELYVKNKEFLVSDSVITFNDTNGKLLALKPDVTLSIIKNCQDEKGVKQKLYYNENVYRVSGSTRQFKELMQTGLECIGDIDLYDTFEVVSLACASLSEISNNYVLEISHLGILSSLLDNTCTNEEFQSAVMECIKQKNSHEIKSLCEKYEVSDDKAQRLCNFVSIYGKADDVLEKLYAYDVDQSFTNAVNELKSIMDLLKSTEYKNNIRIDFSIVNDMNYYNGIVFNGFIEGICETVLFGGRYDKMLKKMNKSSGGIGFALYLDLLEVLYKDFTEFDVDTLVLYDEKVEITDLDACVKKYMENGKRVSAQKSIPSKLRYKEIVDLRGEAK